MVRNDLPRHWTSRYIGIELLVGTAVVSTLWGCIHDGLLLHDINGAISRVDRATQNCGAYDWGYPVVAPSLAKFIPAAKATAIATIASVSTMAKATMRHCWNR